MSMILLTSPQENGFNPAEELLTVIQFVIEMPHIAPFFGPQARAKLESLTNIVAAGLPLEFEPFQALCSTYNSAIKAYYKSRESKHTKCVHDYKASPELSRFLMSMVYNRSISDPSRLNKYKGWSEEVYGEFSSTMISEIIKMVPIESHHKFIDLGSGLCVCVFLSISQSLSWFLCLGFSVCLVPDHLTDLPRCRASRAAGCIGGAV
jgi:hypothetical protein